VVVFTNGFVSQTNAHKIFAPFNRMEEGMRV
jgi:hypothetical protein